MLDLLGQISACFANMQMASAFGDVRREIDKKVGSHEAVTTGLFHN